VSAACSASQPPPLPPLQPRGYARRPVSKPPSPWVLLLAPHPPCPLLCRHSRLARERGINHQLSSDNAAYQGIHAKVAWCLRLVAEAVIMYLALRLVHVAIVVACAITCHILRTSVRIARAGGGAALRSCRPLRAALSSLVQRSSKPAEPLPSQRVEAGLSTALTIVPTPRPVRPTMSPPKAMPALMSEGRLLPPPQAVAWDHFDEWPATSDWQIGTLISEQPTQPPPPRELLRLLSLPSLPALLLPAPHLSLVAATRLQITLVEGVRLLLVPETRVVHSEMDFLEAGICVMVIEETVVRARLTPVTTVVVEVVRV